MRRHHRKLRTLGVKNPERLRKKLPYQRIQQMQQKGDTVTYVEGVQKRRQKVSSRPGNWNISYYPFGDDIGPEDRRGGTARIADPAVQRRHRIAAALLALGGPVLGAVATRRLAGGITGGILGVGTGAAVLSMEPRTSYTGVPGTSEAELRDAAGAVGLHRDPGATHSIYTFRRRHGIDTPRIEARPL